jgi:hypothetical protein
VLAVGSPLPEVRVWPAPREEPVWLEHVLAGEPAVLFFYLWDWSPT